MTDKMFDKTELRELISRVDSVMTYMSEMSCPYVVCESCDLFVNSGNIKGCIYIKLWQICRHLEKVVGE